MRTVSLIAVLVGVLVPIASYADYLQERKQNADRALLSFDKDRKAVRGSDYLLFTFSRNVSLAELRPIVTRTRVALAGVYVCASGGGVMAVQLDPAKQPWSRLGDLNDKEGVAVQLNAARQQMAKLGSETTFVAHDQYCGVDVQGDHEQLAAFRAAMKPQTYMIEATSARTRMAAANVVSR